MLTATSELCLCLLQKSRIVPRHIQLAVRNDEELSK